MTAFSGAAAAYVSSPPGKPYQGLPGLTFSWDGAATPTLTVNKTGDGVCATFSGQSLVQAGVPGALQSAAAPAGSSWEVGPS